MSLCFWVQVIELGNFKAHFGEYVGAGEPNVQGVLLQRVSGLCGPFHFSSQTDIQHCKAVVVLKIRDS